MNCLRKVNEPAGIGELKNAECPGNVQTTAFRNAACRTVVDEQETGLELAREADGVSFTGTERNCEIGRGWRQDLQPGWRRLDP